MEEAGCQVIGGATTISSIPGCVFFGVCKLLITIFCGFSTVYFGGVGLGVKVRGWVRLGLARYYGKVCN